MELIRQIWHRRKCDVPLHRYCAACRKWECTVPKHLGYLMPDRVAVLSFGETFYQGVEVRVRLNPSYGVVDRLGSATQDIGLGIFGDDILISWNIEIDGMPVPADGFHFSKQPAEFCDLVTTHWAAAYVPETKAPDDIKPEFAIPETVDDLELERFQTVNHNVE